MSSTQSINQDIQNAAPYNTVKVSGEGQAFVIDETIVIDKPITLDLRRSVLRKADGFAGPVIRVVGNRYGIPSDPWVPHGYEQPSWNSLVDASGAQIINGFLEGGLRKTPGDGIVFSGGNSSALLRDIGIHNFLGHGLAAGDPDDIISNNYVQESHWDNVKVKNCGALGKSAYIVGRNNAGGSHTNNIRHHNFEVIYPRLAPGISIVNKNAKARIQQMLFTGSCFVHGNKSLKAVLAEEATAANADLFVIHGAGSVGRILRVNVSGMRIIEQEPGYAAIRVDGDTETVFHNCEIASTAATATQAARTGIAYNGAGSSSVSGMRRFNLQEQIHVEAPMAKTVDEIVVSGGISHTNVVGNVRVAPGVNSPITTTPTINIV